ncbi:MAG: YdcH family protein [Thermoanaerobaculia bacterium]|nr:YdcH family protein [Thermoanaerobaculia bacterium]
MATDALKNELIENDSDFRQLHEQHQKLEEKLEGLYSRSLLSQEDEIELKRIKHEKLRLKDQMLFKMRQHESARATA